MTRGRSTLTPDVGRCRDNLSMSSQVAYVEPSLLVWARQSANLVPLAAARKIGVTQARVEEWEAGTRRPTIPELRKAAGVYNRPLGVFFLPEPPQGFETMRDFRRLDPGESGEWSAALHAEYRRAHLQRDAILDVLELDGAEVPEGWQLRGLRGDDSEVAAAIRAHLMEHAPLPFPARSRDKYAHLNYWTSALEEAGVLVMSTEGGQVSTDEMRAFSLYFEDVPVIVLNGADYPRPRTFSLIHEYVHLLLHTEGLCDTTTDTRATTADRRLEARCNVIAATVLMPAGEVLRQSVVAQHEPADPWTLDDLIVAARPFGVSVESFLRRLVTLGLASPEAYQAFRDSNRADAIEAPPNKGGNFFNTKVRDLGKGYVRRVADAYGRTLLDSTTAATYLDVKVGQIARLADTARLKNSAGA